MGGWSGRRWRVRSGGVSRRALPRPGAERPVTATPTAAAGATGGSGRKRSRCRGWKAKDLIAEVSGVVLLLGLKVTTVFGEKGALLDTDKQTKGGDADVRFQMEPDQGPPRGVRRAGEVRRGQVLTVKLQGIIEKSHPHFKHGGAAAGEAADDVDKLT